MKNIVWKGLKYNSLEYLMVKESSKKYKILSTIVGNYEGKNYKCTFNIEIDSKWTVKKFSVNSVVNGAEKIIEGKVSSGKWTINGKECRQFKDFKYIDISITPFTNSLPINNLDFEKEKSQMIEVVYFDILNSKIKPVKQYYKKIDRNTYKYQNLDKNFEAKIKTDNDGLKVYYPKLFKRIN